MTEAAFRGWVRSQLRRMSQRWRPVYSCLNDARRLATEADRERWGGRIKYVYQCAACKDWWPRKRVQADHLVACGSLADIAKDAGPFILRLLCEKPGLQCLHDDCHTKKTQEERRDPRND